MNLTIDTNLLTSDHLLKTCLTLSNNIAVITDDNVAKYYLPPVVQALKKSGCKVESICIPSGEQSKTRETKAKIEDALLNFGFGRDTCLIALGGGVITDLVGFVASTYCRGIPVIYLPTSLLAMVDAAVGGKTGVNTPKGKNLIGSFYDPQAIFMDVATLSTLSHFEFFNAFPEIIKHALIQDADFFAELSQNISDITPQHTERLIRIIKKNTEIKGEIVAQDSREQHRRAILNFGHTIGHALESACHYQLAHGQAVAMGILVESFLSTEMGYLPTAEFQEIKTIISKIDIPLTLPKTLDSSKLTAALKLDKKSLNQSPRFILLDKIGKPHVENGHYTHHVAEALIQKGLAILM